MAACLLGPEGGQGYHPTPAIDMYAFGLLALRVAGGDVPDEHYWAMEEGLPATLEYVQALYTLPPHQAYNTQVNPPPLTPPPLSLCPYAIIFASFDVKVVSAK